MRFQMTARHWLIGAGAATLLVAGGLAAGPVASLAQDGVDADLSEDEAIEVALGKYQDATVLDVESEDEDGTPVYEVTLSNGYELEIDGNNGTILETEQNDEDDRDDGENFDEPGAFDDDEGLLSEASITVDEAIAAAQAEVDGAVGEVELDREGDTLVFEVEVGTQEVRIDATSGDVLGVENDD